MEKQETITISKSEYDRLMERDFWLTCLEHAGVDNWSGFDCAHELKTEYEKEEAEKKK